MIEVIVSPEAIDDLRRIGDWIARDAPMRAAPFLERIKARFDLLSQHPDLGRTREELGRHIRSLPHGKYIIFYRRLADRVEIVRIIHGHRDFRHGLH